MKKIITIITLSLFALSAKAQMTQYNVYMDSVGTVHISTSKTTALALSAYYSNLVNVPSLQTAPTVNSGVTRPINSTTFTISTTKLAWVSYTVNISCTATIGSTANGKVALQYSTNAGSTWIDVSDASNSKHRHFGRCFAVGKHERHGYFRLHTCERAGKDGIHNYRYGNNNFCAGAGNLLNNQNIFFDDLAGTTYIWLVRL